MRQIVWTFKIKPEFKAFVENFAKKAKSNPSEVIKRGLKKVTGYKGEI